jgi:3'(2'), 5'-bisphosphate nucleotidase
MLEEMRRLAAMASALVREAYAKDFRVDYKSPDDPVTEVDHAANALLCAELTRSFPGIPIVAEESDPASFDARLAGGPTFFVDPIDGTRDFILKNGEFAVMIGFADGGRAQLGVVDCPAWDRSYAGGEGVPTYVVATGGMPTPVPQAAATARPMGELHAFVSRSRGDATRAVLGRMGIAKVSLRGGAGVKSVGVVAGEADLYIQVGRAGSLWDSCAPEALAVGAGMRLTDPSGQRYDYARSALDLSHGVLVAPPAVHDAIVNKLTELGIEA